MSKGESAKKPKGSLVRKPQKNCTIKYRFEGSQWVKSLIVESMIKVVVVVVIVIEVLVVM